jgi:hypothetical protein
LGKILSRIVSSDQTISGLQSYVSSTTSKFNLILNNSGHNLPAYSVNANAEALRSKFVAHEGKKEIVIVTEGTRYTVNFAKMAEQFGNRLKENVSLVHFVDMYSPCLPTRLSIQVYMNGLYPTTQLPLRTIR